MGYFGAVMAVATVGGPLLGGFIVDAPFLGWRWCFWVGAPIAIVSLILLQKTLHLPVLKSDAKVDVWGSLLIPGGISLLLVWVTLAGKQFDWISWASAAFAVGGVGLIVAAVMVERRAADPVVPPRLLRDRTMRLTIIGSVAIGIAMFGSSVFFGQYFQVARGHSPTESGLLTLPMVVGLLIASTVTGQLVTRFGRWKRYLVGGHVLMVAGLALLGTIDHATPLPLVGIYMGLVGLGVGASMQNLVLAAQNTLSYRDLGSGTSTVTFFRSLGGAAGISVLGAVFANHVTSLVNHGLAGRPNATALTQSGGSTSLDVAAMPESVRLVVQHAYGDGIALVFVLSAAVSVIALIAVLFMREASLRTTVDD
jgi:MFS family permease